MHHHDRPQHPGDPVRRPGLGPHVVGQRVVVRRVVPGETGPSGGPAMTDVLGTCTAWGEGRCVVVRADGGAVEIPLADIVSGKPVPPRASVRHRVPALEVERHAFELWPAMTVEPVGAWTLRQCPREEGRARRRANSMLAMGDPGIPVAEASARARRFYADRGQVSLAQVEPGTPEEAALLGEGWTPLGAGGAHCQLAPVGRALRACTPDARPLPDCTLTERPDRILVEAGGRARGRAVLDGDWLGIADLHVSPGERRAGLGTAVVAELLDWGASQGATTAWLHVERDNPGALALYEGLGFVTHHDYDYLVDDIAATRSA